MNKYLVRLILGKVLGDSLSITAQCIEIQLMPNESSGKDLQIIYGDFYVRLLFHGVLFLIIL